MRLQIEAYHASALAYAAVKLGLPDRMGERALTAKQLAGELGLSAPHLSRFLRGLVTLGICKELPDGTFALAPGGWSLRSDSHSRLDKKVQIVVEQYWRPWADLVSCLKTGKPAFDHVFGMSVGEWRERNPAQGLMFESYLTDETFAPGRLDPRSAGVRGGSQTNRRYRRRLRRAARPAPDRIPASHRRSIRDAAYDRDGEALPARVRSISPARSHRARAGRFLRRRSRSRPISIC